MPDNYRKRTSPVSDTSPDAGYIKFPDLSERRNAEILSAIVLRRAKYQKETSPIWYALRSVYSASIAVSRIRFEIFLLQYFRVTISKSTESENKNSPPGGSEYLLHLLLFKKNRRHIIGDLEEEFYEDMVPKFGIKAARRWYRWQAFRAIGLGLFKLAAALEFLKKIACG